MRAMILRGARDLAIESVSESAPGPGEVSIEVLLCGVCGSDVHGYLGHSDRRTKNTPLVMGHEIVGRVSTIGPDVENGLPIGSRVVVHPMIACGTCAACRAGLENICPNMSIYGIELSGGFAERMNVRADRLLPIPDDLPDEVAVFAEPLAIEVRLFRQAIPSLVRSLLVLGVGAQGLLAIQLARIAGIPRIIASDTLDLRLALARSMGATNTVNALDPDAAEQILAMTNGLGVEVAVETAGASAARQTGVAVLARGGTFAIVGLGQRTTAIDFLDIVSGEKVVRGIYCYSDDEFARALELLASGAIETRSMAAISPLADGFDIFASIVDGSSPVVKHLLRPV